ncbi:hypothetical protein LSCM4_08274 [Leishmania orientalis]|uniref:TatD related DNase n=1 Tax=Leishmania orientalis TaxID=2249476 RepID=A0A836HAX4_9TRYP|nr:hypothetical protein LSCM4_08274 [Leishmania orientalis]
MGFVDRGGGREAKGSSLRRSRKNPGAPTTKNKSAHRHYTTTTTRATPTVPLACLPVLKALVAPAAGEGDTVGATTASAMVGFENALAAVKDAVEAGNALYIDAAVALLSRKLEEGQEGIFRRAVEEGRLAAIVCWCGEVERQSLLLDTCMQHNKLYRGESEQQQLGTVAAAKAGVLLYAMLGIHVDNIDRVNMRLHDQWIKELETNVKHGDVVGVLTGLNLSRDHGTHYAQERLFKECWRIASEAHLPLVLHLHAADAAALTETVNRAAELLDELLAAAPETADTSGAAPSAVVLYNGLRALHASSAMRQLVRAHRPAAAPTPEVAPFYILTTADGLSVSRTEGGGAETTAPAESGPSAEALAALLPSRAGLGSDPASATSSSSGGDPAVHLSQLIIGTGAPLGTPQNLPDPYLRTLPNEPGNYPYVVQTLYDIMQAPAAAAALTLADLEAIAVVNHLRVFFRECVSAQQQSGRDDEATTNAVQQQQQPGPVAGLTDSDAKRDLELLLAEAAKERAQMERERLREEAAREQARSEELLERRLRREKKTNVKANNRSNFTHFRNKNFAPRQRQQVRGGDLGMGDDARERAPSSSSTTTNSDGAAAPNSLAAEVEQLLQARVPHRDPELMLQRQQKPAGKGKGKEKGKVSGSAEIQHGAQSQQRHCAGAVGKKSRMPSGTAKSESPSGSSDAGETRGPAGTTMGKAGEQSSRRQRRRQQRRQQQHEWLHCNDNNGADSRSSDDDA